MQLYEHNFKNEDNLIYAIEDIKQTYYNTCIQLV